MFHPKDMHIHVLELPTISHRFVESLCIKLSKTTKEEKSEETFSNRKDFLRQLWRAEVQVEGDPDKPEAPRPSQAVQALDQISILCRILGQRIHCPLHKHRTPLRCNKQ